MLHFRMQIKPKRIILAGIIGNIIEYYDFALIGFMATIIGHHFFPANNPALSTLSTFAAFAAGMVMRPIGALIFGHIGDTLGRKKAMLLSLALMALPTFAIGLLPTYETIGIIAPILLVALRILQGLSVGGEYASSIVYLIEHAPEHRRYLYGSFVSVGAKAGMSLGSGVLALLFLQLGDEAMEAWGWRMPFFASLALALLGFWLRRTLIEEYQLERSTRHLPIIELWRHYRMLTLKLFGIAAAVWVLYYALFVYAITWIVHFGKLTKAEAVRMESVTIMAGLGMMLFAAYLADRFGGLRIMRAGFLLGSIATIPILLWQMELSYWGVLMTQLLLVAALAMVQAPIFATVTLALPPYVRTTATAFILGTAAGVVGGTTPMILDGLITLTNDPIAGGYLITAAMVGALILLRQH
ncbi:MAG: MFS transporter [Campylobacterales bacterium]